MDDILNIDWAAELSNQKVDVQAQWDIFTSNFKDSEEQCILKTMVSERARKYPVPVDIKSQAKIKKNNKSWKKYLQNQRCPNL